MQKTISILVLGAAILSVFMCGCNTLSGKEDTTDYNENIIEAIEKSSPITSGNLITKTKTDDDGNININYYDDNDNLVEQFIWDEDENVSHIIMSYTAENKIKTKEEISPDGKSNIVYSYSYNDNDELNQISLNEFENGVLKKSTNYDTENKITGYSQYYYNDNLLTKIEVFDANKKMTEYFMYEYDTNGNKTKYSSFTADSNLKRFTTFDYNDEEQLIKEIYYSSSNEIENYFIYEYYESGKIKTSTKYDLDGNEISKNYYEDTTK